MRQLHLSRHTTTVSVHFQFLLFCVFHLCMNDKRPLQLSVICRSKSMRERVDEPNRNGKPFDYRKYCRDVITRMLARDYARLRTRWSKRQKRNVSDFCLYFFGSHFCVFAFVIVKSTTAQHWARVFFLIVKWHSVNERGEHFRTKERRTTTTTKKKWQKMHYSCDARNSFVTFIVSSLRHPQFHCATGRRCSSQHTAATHDKEVFFAFLAIQRKLEKWSFRMNKRRYNFGRIKLRTHFSDAFSYVRHTCSNRKCARRTNEHIH